MSEEIQEQQEPEIIGPGQLLKQAREKAGLTTAEIADKLRLKVASIEDLEADIYDEAISLTFTRGYLKLYARQVQLSEDVVLEAFDKLNTKGKEPAKLQSFSRRVARQASDDRLMLVTYLIVFAVIALVVVWWWQQSSSDSAVQLPTFQESNESDPIANNNVAVVRTADVEQPTVQNSAPVVDEQTALEQPIAEQTANEHPITEEPAPEAQLDVAPDTSSPDTSDIQTPQAETLPVDRVDSAEDTSAEQSEVPGEDQPQSDATVEQVVGAASDVPPIELVFQFSGDCWMNLTDATGEAIAYGVKASGRIMPVSGVPPFEVTLGAPESVQISYDGVAVDMSRFAAGRTARFTLPFSE